ncbi:SusC/RagA family TonB-linked outer membrane protein [Siphonobacter sp. SORGH_AS_0500]|uniref:SusC/RagA family TonB-linked outer membrane protein n=1 Tax=Siphonobacter sp. SORGH_AS_0500 TaxID=1864824 RepID=UPI000CAA021D|nr:SusC/RagA family TonB-linked outer membrane protein [Siphonobacter sp. SORGH_AS_0500]MDR6193376.1 TonB-linked SusC/RagA family outer membrane protein [Siphonobacter sp. SORGH_AS_0500]PKK36831.1 SusC/RagA family TonB-linked outer membrane protein [Siphonobacter sp. SORGH_AS_0500]
MKKLLFFTFLLLFGWTAQAQDRVVTGRVTSSDDGSPIPGVSIVVKGTTKGTTSDANGNYRITISDNATSLVFSSIGLSRVEEAINGRTTIDVVLQPTSESLNEVVVTAQGIERDTRSLGYATQNVNGSALAQRSEPNVLNTLQGKVAGVNITSSSGAPGASTNINIRGITSFNGNNQPLIVVDGIIFSNDVDNSQNTLFGSQPSSRLSDISPESIESINVLKGPAASVLYGSRASAGVIVITTKSGKGLNGKTEVTFNSSVNWQNVAYLPKFQNRYGQGTQNNYVNNSTASWGPAFGTPGFDNVQTAWGETVPYQAYPNNVRDFYQTGTMFQNSLNIAGGDQDNNFAATISSTIQDGVVRRSGFDRHSVQVGGNSKLKNGVKLGGTITYVKSAQTGTIMGNGGSAFGQITRIPRSFDLVGRPYQDATGKSIYFVNGQNHPLWSLENEFYKSNVDRVFGNLSVGYDITNWLNVSYRVTADTYTDNRKQVLRIGAARAPQGQIDEDLRFRSELNGDLLINANKKDLFVQGLNATLLLGQNLNQRSFKQSGVGAEALTIPGFDNVSNGSVFTSSYESSTRRRLVGHYGQLSLDYKSYLFLELSGRVDQSSTLPKGQNAYFYPSAALSFVPLEAFKVESDVISYAKVRGNIARVGRDADPYLLQSVYTTAAFGNNVADVTFPLSVGGSSIPGFQISNRIGSMNLKPEFVTSYEAGLNLGFFNNRLGIDFTFFNTKSTSQIFDVAISNSSGYDTRTTNIGEMRNRGIELQVSATPVHTKSFKWDLMLNFTRIRNKVISIAPGVTNSTINGDGFIGISPSIAEGYPYGVIIGTANARSESGELLINPNTGGFLPGIAGQVISNPQKDWIAGLTNNFSFKGITLSALFDINKGGQIYSFSQVDMRSAGQTEITGIDRDQPRILPGVIQNADGTTRPNNIQVSAQTYWAGLGGLASEGAVFDATAYRLREVSLSYALPKTLLSRTPFGNISVGVSGRNLWMFAPGFPSDPEINTQGAGNIQGLDLNGIPTTRNYGVNLRVTF